MAQDKIPIQIAITADKGQLSIAMADIQKVFKAMNRKVSQDTVKQTKKSLQKVTDAQIAAGERRVKLDRLHTNAIIQNRLMDEAKAAARKASFDKDLARQKKNQLGQIAALEKSLMADRLRGEQLLAAHRKKTAADRLTTEMALAGQIMAMDKAHQAAILINNKITQDKIIRDKKRAAAVAYSNSTAGVFKAAGIKGPDQRIKEVKALTRAQKLLRHELKRGAITRLQYNTMLGDTRKRMNLLNRGDVRARMAIHRLTAKLASLTFELTGAVFGLLTMGAALSSPALIGVGFLRKMEDTKLGITGIMLAMGEVNGQSLTFAQGMMVAEEQVDALAISAMSLSGTLGDFTKSFQAVLAPGLAAGMSIEELRKISIAGTVAVKTIGLDSRQVVQEIRDLVAGGIQAASSTLATSLGLKDSDIKKAKLSAQGLYKFLLEKLKGFETAALERDKTLSGKMEQTWEAFVIGMSKVSEPVFNNLKDLFSDLFDVIGKFKDVKGQEVFVFNESFLESFRGYIKMLADGLAILKDMIMWFIKWKDELMLGLKILAGYKILKFMGRWVGGMAMALEGVIAKEMRHIAILRAKSGLLKRIQVANAAAAATSVSAATTGVGAGVFGGFMGGLSKARSTAKNFFTRGLPGMALSGGRMILAAIGPVGIIMAILWGAYSMFQAESDLDKLNKKIAKLRSGDKEGEKQLQGVYDVDQANKELDKFAEVKLKLQSKLKDAQELTGQNKVVKFGLVSAAQKELDDFQVTIDEANKKLKGLKEAIDDPTEASKDFSNQVTRMNGALINAKKALEDSGDAFMKGAKEGERMGAQSLTIAVLTNKYIKLSEARKNLTSGEKADTVLQSKLKNMNTLMDLIKQSGEEQKKIDDLQSQVKSSDISSKERDILKDRLSVQEKIAEKVGIMYGLQKNILLVKEQILKNEEALKTANPEDIKDIKNAQAVANLHLKNLKAKKDVTDLRKADEESIDTVTAKQIAADQALKDLTKTTRDYGVSLADKLALQQVELDFAGGDGSEIKRLNEELDLNKKIVKIKDDHQKMIDKIATGGQIDGYLNEADVIRQRNAEIREAINLLRDFQIQSEALNNQQKSWAQGQKEALKSYVTNAQNTAGQVAALYDAGFAALESDMTNFFKKGEMNLAHFLEKILDAILKIMIQKMIAQAIVGSFDLGGGGGGGGVTTSFPNTPGASTQASDYGGNNDFAKGGVFDPTGLIAFAKGGIVSTPTTFPFAKGMGLMGEAGPEAIMPLSRTTSGELGVKAEGMGGGGVVNSVSVNVNINNDGSSDTETTNTGGDAKAMGNAMGQLVQTEIIKQMRPGGLLNRTG